MNARSARPPAGAWREHLEACWETDRGHLLHAAKTYLAVIASMWVCMRLELATPRTAMVSTVILMMQQQAGMVIAKGIYRGIGMTIGSVMGFLLIALFAQQPWPFLLALSAWIGLCVWGASYYRNFQSYGFVLAGYATATSAVPFWANPYGIFDSFVHTLSEVAIAIACASLVSALLFPRHASEAILESGRRHLDHFLLFLRQALRSSLPQDGVDALHLALVSERPQLENLRAASVYEPPQFRLSNTLMIRLNREFLDASAGLHAVRRIRERIADRKGTPAAVAMEHLIDDFLALLPDVGEGRQAMLAQLHALHARLNAYLDALPGRIEILRWTLSEANSAARLDFDTEAVSFYAAARDFLDYLDDFIAVRDPGRPRTERSGARRPERIISTANKLEAVSAGFRAAIASALAAAAWLASGWIGGSGALIQVAIACALYTIAPQPARTSRQTFVGCLAAWAAAFVFNFFVLPRLDGFTLLAAALAPVIMVGSYLTSLPETSVLGLGFSINFCFIVGIANPAVYDPAALLDLGLSTLLGLAAAALAFAIVVPYGSDLAIESYLRQIRRLVARMAHREPIDHESLLRFESSLRDFTIQLAARPADASARRRHLLGWAFAALEIGRAAILIRRDAWQYAADLPAGWPGHLREWQGAIAGLFEQVTAERHREALEKTRRALAALPSPACFDPAPATIARFRLRALLRATELSLMDPAFPLNPAAPTGP